MRTLEELGWTDADPADAAKYGWKMVVQTRLVVAWPGEDFAANGEHFRILCGRIVSTPEGALCRVKLQWLRENVNLELRRELESRGFWS